MSKFDWDQYEDAPQAESFSWDDYEDAPPTKDYNSPEAQAAEAQATLAADRKFEHSGKGEALARGGVQGVTAGLSDEIVGTLKGMGDDFKALISGQNANKGVTPEFDQFGNVSNGQELTGDYKKYRDEERELNKLSSDANPVLYKGSELVGSIAQNAFVPGASSMAGSVGLSGLQGLGNSDADNFGGLAKDTSIGALWGAAGKKLGDAAGFSATKGAAAEALEQTARQKAVKSLNPILSQQELLDKRGIADQLGKEMLDSNAIQFGDSVDNMLPRVEALLAEKGEKLGAARRGLDDLGAKIDLNELSPYVENINEAAKSMGSADATQAIASAEELARILKKPNRTMEETATLLRSLSKGAGFEKRSAPAKSLGIQDIYDKVRTLNDEAAFNTSPELAEDMIKNRELFSVFKNGEQILEKATARQAKNATFGLRDVGIGATQMVGDNAPDAEKTMKAIALAMASKLVRERGNASMAVTARKLADFAKGAPGLSAEEAQVVREMVTAAMRSGAWRD